MFLPRYARALFRFDDLLIVNGARLLGLVFRSVGSRVHYLTRSCRKRGGMVRMRLTEGCGFLDGNCEAIVELFSVRGWTRRQRRDDEMRLGEVREA
jgi:hypothetical protein